MSIYKRDPFLPEWEPIPCNLTGADTDEQERGFHERAIKPIVWRKVPRDNFPAEGIFWHQRHWFTSHGIAYFASHDGEDLIPHPERMVWLARPAGMGIGLAPERAA